MACFVISAFAGVGLGAIGGSVSRLEASAVDVKLLANNFGNDVLISIVMRPLRNHILADDTAR